MQPASCKVALSDNLLCLERGSGELLLVTTPQPSPLHVRRGRGHLRSFLDAVEKFGNTRDLLTRFPNDARLLEMFRQHRIVRFPRSPMPARTSQPQLGHRQPAAPRSLRAQRPRGTGRASLSLYLLLSHSCNMRCVYCLNGSETYQRDNAIRMPDKVAFRALERFSQLLRPDGRLEIVFFGGEPLLNWPLAKEVILRCEGTLRQQRPRLSIQYHLTSNLTFIPHDLVTWARKYNISFLCDVDGPADLHNATRPYSDGRGSHADTSRNVRQLVSEGFDVALRATVTSHNVDRILDIAAHHKDLGASGSAFVAVNPVTSDEDVLPAELLPDPDTYVDGVLAVHSSGLWSSEQLHPMNVYLPRVVGFESATHGCGAPYGNTPVVDAGGNVFPCIYLVGISRYKLGNVFQDVCQQPDVIEGMLAALDVDNLPECRDCSWRYFCGGGCPVVRLTVVGNPRATPETIRYSHEMRCRTTKSLVEALLWEYADRLDPTDGQSE